MTTEQLTAKAWRIVNGCQSAAQARVAMRWIERVELADANIDTSLMWKELNVLFNRKYYG